MVESTRGIAVPPLTTHHSPSPRWSIVTKIVGKGTAGRDVKLKKRQVNWEASGIRSPLHLFTFSPLHVVVPDAAVSRFAVFMGKNRASLWTQCTPEAFRSLIIE